MSVVCIAVYTWSSVRIHGLRSLTFLYDHFLGLTFAAFVESVILATVTYITSFRGENTPLLAEGGNTGNHIYDVSPASSVETKNSGSSAGSSIHESQFQCMNTQSNPSISKLSSKSESV